MRSVSVLVYKPEEETLEMRAQVWDSVGRVWGGKGGRTGAGQVLV